MRASTARRSPTPSASWACCRADIGDAAARLGEQLGLEPAELGYTSMGGNSPQSLVNATSLDILAGALDVAILSGGEAWRTFMRARKMGVTIDWDKGESDPDPVIIGKELEMNQPEETERGIYMPVQVYPMFETALRAAAGRTVDEHQQHLGELWSDLSHVAAGNEYAWIRDAKSPEEITTVTANNRMIGFPYPKYMNSNNDVDMGAAHDHVLGRGRAPARGARGPLGVPALWCGLPRAQVRVASRHVRPHTGDRARRAGARSNWPASPSTTSTIVDLYSCFPSAVQLGAASLGLDLDRQWSRTGGLPFAGGPWNNYVMHAIASVVTDLREQPGEHGLVWANGGYATKHAFGVYSTEPPAHGFRHADPQDEIDRLPRRELASPADAAGPATIEAYTVMYSRDGEPEQPLAACLLADGRRGVGIVDRRRDRAAAMCDGEWVGTAVTLTDDGTLHLD